MRGALLLTAAVVVGTAVADVAHMRRHGHDAFHQRRNQIEPRGDATCGCTTEIITFYGSPVPVTITPQPTSTVTSQTVRMVTSTSSNIVSTVVVTPVASSSPVSSIPVSASPAQSTPSSSPSPAPTLPTPSVTSFSSTGVFTIPATTMTVTDTTTVCGATTTNVPSGSHTFGGVTTVVETSTTVVCPYATVKPTGSTVTSVIETTTYVCPSAGTYTIAPMTTHVPSSTVLVYPTPQTITPGVYSHSEQTVTATRTDFTYVCPFTGASEPTSSPAPVTTISQEAHHKPKANHKPEAQPKPKPQPKPAPQPKPKPQPKPEAKPKPKANHKLENLPIVGSILGNNNGNHMGITYSPYTDSGACQSKSEVLKDIALAKQEGFTHIRVYGTDCNSLEYIGEACRLSNLMMILGVFIEDTGVQGAQSQVQAISNWAQWDLVSLIVVGNEAIDSGYVDAGTLAGFVDSSRQVFEQAGYSGMVTTTEPIEIWQQYGSTLCGAVDVLGANIHPFFNPDVTASDAGHFVLEEVKILRGICNGMDVINLETGWPSQGEANGAAVPSPQDQQTAIKSIEAAYGDRSVFFSFSNDMWKSPGAFAAEQYWGCIDVF